MDVEGLSNRELVAHLVGAGPDDPAWLEFVSRFQNRIRLTIHRTFRSESLRNPGLDVDRSGEVVRDLTQDVFLRLLDGNRRAFARFKGKSEYSIYTYLNAVAVNLVHDHFKKLRAQKTPPAPASLDQPLDVAREGTPGSPLGDRLASRAPGPDRAAADTELRDRIHRVIERMAMPQRDALVFRLFFQEGLTVDEIASCGGIGLSSSGIEKCIRRLRDAITAELGGPAHVGQQTGQAKRREAKRAWK